MNYGECQVIFTSAACMKRGRTHYITPTPQTMARLIREHYDRNPSLQTYWRNAKGLEDKGYITRQARWNTTDRNNPRRKPSIIALTIKGAKYLTMMGNAWAAQILGAMLKWVRKYDQRPPKYYDPESNVILDYEAELAEIRDRAIKLGYI